MYLTGTTFLRITQTSQSQPENILQHKGLTRRTSRRFIFRALENPSFCRIFHLKYPKPCKYRTHNINKFNNNYRWLDNTSASTNLRVHYAAY